jgi:hypothetical protein
MFELLRSYFCNVERAHFERDLAEKEFAVLIRDSAQGTIFGFSTLMRFGIVVDGRNVQALYSGDTIVDEAARQQTELHRVWLQLAWSLAQEASKGTYVYWLMASCGYRTYRFFPIFFRRFYPTGERDMPPEIQKHRQALCKSRFGDEYNEQTGVVQFHDAAPLRDEDSQVPAERLRDPRVAFFLAANPGHVYGHGLACLAPITQENLAPASLRALRLRTPN